MYYTFQTKVLYDLDRNYLKLFSTSDEMCNPDFRFDDL